MGISLQQTVRALTAAVLFVASMTSTVPAGDLSGQAMGTTWRIRLGSDVSAPDDLQQTVAAEIERLEGIFSLYRDDSELSRWNARRHQEPIPVSGDLLRVAARAIDLAKETEGAFDPTIGPLSRLWKLRSGDPDWAPPTDADVSETLRHIGWDKLEILTNQSALRKRDQHLELDLNALVEGDTLGRIRELLIEHGVKSALIEFGGEFTAIGGKTADVPWRVGVENARDPLQLIATVALRDRSLSTSGVYRQERLWNGRRCSHVLDPRTGFPVTHETVAASVVSNDPASADGLATALMVMGQEAGVKWAADKKVSALFQSRQGSAAPIVSSIGKDDFPLRDQR
jgi:thiamine biosynthesis lipoprotein